MYKRKVPMSKSTGTTRKPKKKTVPEEIPMSCRAKWERVFVSRKRTLMQKCLEIEKIIGCLVTLTIRTKQGEIWYYATDNNLQQSLWNGKLIDDRSIRTTRSTLEQNILIGKCASENPFTGDNTLDWEQQLRMDNTAFIHNITPSNVTVTTITEIDDNVPSFAPEQNTSTVSNSVLSSSMETKEVNPSKVAADVNQTKKVFKSKIKPRKLVNATVEKSCVSRKRSTLDKDNPANPSIILERLKSNKCTQNDNISVQSVENTNNAGNQQSKVNTSDNKPTSTLRGAGEHIFYDSSSEEDHTDSIKKGKLANGPSFMSLTKHKVDNCSVKKKVSPDSEGSTSEDDSDSDSSSSSSDSSSSSSTSDSESEDSNSKNDKNRQAFSAAIEVNSGAKPTTRIGGCKKQNINGKKVQSLNGQDQEKITDGDRSNKGSRKSKNKLKPLLKNEVKHSSKKMFTEMNEFLEIQPAKSISRKSNLSHLVKDTKKAKLPTDHQSAKSEESRYSTSPKVSKNNIGEEDRKMKLDGPNSQASEEKLRPIPVAKIQGFTKNMSSEKTNKCEPMIKQSDKAHKPSCNTITPISIPKEDTNALQEKMNKPFVIISPVTQITSKTNNYRKKNFKKENAFENHRNEWSCRRDIREPSSISNRRSEEVHRSQQTIKKSFGNTRNSFSNYYDPKKQFQQRRCREKSVPRNFKPFVSDQNNNYTSDNWGRSSNEKRPHFDQSYKNKPFSSNRSFLPEVKTEKNEYDFMPTTAKNIGNEILCPRAANNETRNTTSRSSLKERNLPADISNEILCPRAANNETRNTTSKSSLKERNLPADKIEKIGTTPKNSRNRNVCSNMPSSAERANYGNSRKRSRSESSQHNNGQTQYVNVRKLPKLMNLPRKTSFRGRNKNFSTTGSNFSHLPKRQWPGFANGVFHQSNNYNTIYDQNWEFTHSCDNSEPRHDRQRTYSNGEKQRAATGERVRGGGKRRGSRGRYRGGHNSGHAKQSNCDNSGYANNKQSYRRSYIPFDNKYRLDNRRYADTNNGQFHSLPNHEGKGYNVNAKYEQNKKTFSAKKNLNE